MQNYNSYYQQPNIPISPNAVNINIISPQAYGGSDGMTCPINNGYSLYGNNQGMPIYPSNYNNMFVNPTYNMQNPMLNAASIPQETTRMQAHQGFAPEYATKQTQDDLINQRNMSNQTNLIEKTENSQTETKTQENNKTKKVTPLTDDYVKSLENYMNDQNPKVRLIGAKELLERFKEDENRKDNPSLMPLLNKALRDSSPSVRFLGLTMLQLGYAVGNDETVTILKEIQTQNKDKIGEDSLLASEILLKMSAGQKIDVPMTQAEIEAQNAKKSEAK